MVSPPRSPAARSRACVRARVSWLRRRRPRRARLLVVRRRSRAPSSLKRRPLSESPIASQALPRNIRNRNQKFNKNVTKRGNVSIGKAADREEDFPVSKSLIVMFLVLVVGSSLVGVFNLFGKAPAFGDS